MVLSTLGQDAQAEFNEVNVEEGNQEQPLEEGSEVFDGVNPIGLELPSGAKLGVGSGGLISPTEITLKVFEDRPEGRDPRFAPIGDRVVVELPFSQIDLSDLSTRVLFIWAPADLDAYENAFRPLQEVSVLLGDGQEYTFLDHYGHSWAVKLTAGILKSIFREFPEPIILRVSVQPVDAKEWYRDISPDLFDDSNDSSNGLGTQQLITLQNNESEKLDYWEGLFRIPDNTNLEEFCDSNPETMPDLNNSASPPEDKTPLVLIHGWTLLNDFETGEILGSTVLDDYPKEPKKSKFAPALCYWKGFIPNFISKGLNVSSFRNSVSECIPKRSALFLSQAITLDTKCLE